MKPDFKTSIALAVCILVSPRPALSDDPIRVDTNGKVGISTNSPAEALHVTGKTKVTTSSLSSVLAGNDLTFNRYGGDSYIVQTDITGGLRFQVGGEDDLIMRDDRFDISTDDILLTGASKASCAPLNTSSSGYIVCSSSITLKENVEDYPGGLDIVSALHPVSYNYKDRERYGNEREIGLIAEEVDKVAPELTTYNPPGTPRAGLPKGVRYTQLPVVLINSIKELEARVEALEARSR